jgi:hypothetical protein
MHPRFTLSLLGALLGLCVAPIGTLACRSPLLSDRAAVIALDSTASNSTAPRSAPTQLHQTNDLATWQGNYNFIEGVQADDGPPMYMNYDVRIALARCGWRSSLAVNGHLTSLDMQTTVRAIDDNTIGLYYQQDIVPTLQPPRFKSGELLLRIQRELSSASKSPKKSKQPTTPIYRVYFEGLEPLIPNHKATGLEISPPQPLSPTPQTKSIVGDRAFRRDSHPPQSPVG